MDSGESEPVVLTVGHSTHSYGRFLELLRSADVTAVADVRSAPFSRHFPHFSRDPLKARLHADGISYVSLGKELGGRPSGGQYFCGGVADYERMAQAPEFASGLRRVLEGSRIHRIALMCAEHDPLDCHRCLLVGRALSVRGAKVEHLLSDGARISHPEIETRLLETEGQVDVDLFRPTEERLAEAYRRRARRVAYADRPDGGRESSAAR